MAINIGKALSGDRDFVREDIAAVARVADVGGALLKVLRELRPAG